MADFDLLGRDPVPTEERIAEDRLNELESYARAHGGEWIVVPADLAAVLDVEQWLSFRPRTVFERWFIETDATTGHMVVRIIGCG